MPETDLLTADEAAKSLRISRRTFDGHVARGDIAYIAVGLGVKRIRKRFAPEDIDRFRDRQRRVEQPPGASRGDGRAVRVSENMTIDFKALLDERRAERRMAREADDGGPARPRRPI
jgi:hypothetical protein